MSQSMWKKIDESHAFLSHVGKDDYCFYAREYKISEGYQGGETNSLVLNFKKKPAQKNTASWDYRVKAVRKFASEIKTIEFTKKHTIIAIPESCKKGDLGYTNRFEDLFAELNGNAHLEFDFPIQNENTVPSAHSGKGSRDPNKIIQNYSFKGFKAGGSPENIIILDDVITTGSQYRAVCNLLRNNNCTGDIIGLFWAMSI